MMPVLSFNRSDARWHVVVGCLAVLLVFGGGAAHAAELSITINSPTRDGLVGNRVEVDATVSSMYELRRVVASVESASAELQPTLSALDLSALGPGPKTLEVTAEDVFGNRASATVSVLLDRAPSLTVLEPAPHTFSKGRLAVHFRCEDDEGRGCVAVSLHGPSGEVASWKHTGNGSWEARETADVKALDGLEGDFLFQAVDSRGQVTEVRIPGAVDTSRRLVELATVQGAILDFDGERILHLEQGGTLRVRFLTSGVDQVLHTQAPPSTLAFLTSGGVIFALRGENGTSGPLYYWPNQGEATLLGQTWTLDARGDYALFGRDQGLVLRQLSTGTESMLPSSAVWPRRAVVAADGTAYVAERVSDGSLGGRDYLHRIHAGQTETVVSEGGGVVSDFETDGSMLRYSYKEGGHGNRRYTTVWASGTPAPAAPVSCRGPVHVAGGWAAEGRSWYVDNIDLQPVYRRNLQGTWERVTFFTTPSEFETLAPDGQVIATNQGRRYLVLAGAEPLELSSKAGTPCWGGDRWLVVSGRTLLELNLGELPPEPEEDVKEPSSCGATGASASPAPWLGLALLAVLGRALRRSLPGCGPA